MAKMIAGVGHDGSITVMVDGYATPAPIGTDHINYSDIKEMLLDYFSIDNGYDTKTGENPNFDFDEFFALIEISQSVHNFVNSEGTAQVVDGNVVWKGHVLNNNLTDRILDLMNQGFPVTAMLRFLDNVMENPSYKSREELYSFLEHRNMPLTPNGCFVAYKRVMVYDGANYTDINGNQVTKGDMVSIHCATDGKHIRNNIGDIVSMPRSLVDDNHGNHCSAGLHVGAISYVNSYCNHDIEKYPVVLVEVNPRDAVSVPTDHDFTKLRTCQYTVIEQYKGELEKAVYDMDDDNEPDWMNNDEYDDYEDE